MSRLTVALLLAVLTAETFSATQTIEATAGYNFIAVELKVGENRLRELFPDAPVGTLIFTWDNYAGWNAAQMYPFGWSHPNRQILPREGMVMQLPSRVSYRPTLTGEIVPLPPPHQWVIFQGTERSAQLYSGLNLVSASLIDPLRTQRVISYNKTLQSYISHQFDDLDNNWLPFVPREGAVWLTPTGAPVHPQGTFSSTNTALYFNNYAPTFGIDSPFIFPNCEQRLGLTAQLMLHGQGGTRTPVNEPANISTNGYIDPFSNHIRYIPAGSYSVRLQGPGDFQGESDLFNVPPTDINSIILPPYGMYIAPTVPVFRRQPDDVSFRPGDDVHLEALFHHAGTLDPQISLDLPYQWQKQNAAGEWIDITGADETTLHLENAQPQHAGAYRLRATYGCEHRYSRTAMVTLTASTISSMLTTNGQISLTIQFPVQVAAKLQSSMNLTNWQDEMNIAASSNWTTNLNAETSAKFYRVVEAP